MAPELIRGQEYDFKVNFLALLLDDFISVLTSHHAA